MSAFLTYPGSKARVADRILGLMSPHRVYVEPFCGMATILLAKRRARYEVINDLDGRLVNLLRVVRDRPAELAGALALTPYARTEYLVCDPDEPDLDDLERARRTAVRIGQSFAKAGLAQPSRGWRMSLRGGRACGMTWADLPDRVLGACERLRGVHMESLPALDLVRRYGVEDDALLYVDPPYVGTTRSSGQLYAHEMPREDQHRELAAALHECRAHVLLSGYHGDLYDELYGDWDRAEFAAIANNNGESGADPRRMEVVWSNRPLHTQGDLLTSAALNQTPARESDA